MSPSTAPPSCSLTRTARMVPLTRPQTVTSCAMTLPSICAPSPIRRSEARNSPLIRPKTCAGPLHSMLPTIDIPEPIQERGTASVVGSRLGGGCSTTEYCCCTVLQAETAVYLFDDWFDPIETCVRDRVREFIQAMIEGELDATLLRPRYGRLAKHAAADKVVPSAVGHRHGRRSRSLTGTFGRVEIEVPRARLEGANGKTTEWQSKVLRAYQRRTLAADALIASTYLSGTNTRRVRRALKALFGGAVSKDTVSRIWRKVKADWESWNARSLADEPIVRLILDGTVVRVRLDRKATSISLLIVIGVRADGQK